MQSGGEPFKEEKNRREKTKTPLQKKANVCQSGKTVVNSAAGFGVAAPQRLTRWELQPLPNPENFP